LELAVANRRAPCEIVHVDGRVALRGLSRFAIGFGSYTRAETGIRSQDQIQVDVADTGTAFAINFDQLVRLRIVAAGSLLHSCVQIGIVKRIQLLAGEKRDFGFDRSDQQRNACRQLRSCGIERISLQRATVDNWSKWE